MTFDTRSEGEFLQGHVPGSINLPLFNNQERALVGTAYKQKGFEQAFQLGLKYSGPKLESFVKTALKHKKEGEYCKILCWRGGMRSQSMAWLFKTAGLSTARLEGGYKAFRQWVLSLISRPYSLKVLGGFTGSGKTAVLKRLKQEGKQIIDLEALASHRGSAFGALNMPQQPSCEQFENLIAISLMSVDPTHDIWVEDESRMIGTCKIPDAFFNRMAKAPLYFLNCSKEIRIRNLIEEYGKQDRNQIIDSVKKLHRRLGGARTQDVIRLLHENQLFEAAGLLIEYYDKSYLYDLQKRISTGTVFFE